MEKFIHVGRCDSTQELLKEQLTLFPDVEITLSCDVQTHGRGRGSNLWEDSEGTVCFSMSIQPHIKTTFTALELSTLVADFFSSEGIDLRLKWPNDLLTNEGKKCGGILVQGIGMRYIAGIGINLFSANESFGGVFETSFHMEKKVWSQKLSQYIRCHRYQNTEAIIEQWSKYCFHLGHKVNIIDGNEKTSGIFVGLGSHGEAVLQNEAGLHHLYNGSLRLI